MIFRMQLLPKKLKYILLHNSGTYTDQQNLNLKKKPILIKASVLYADFYSIRLSESIRNLLGGYYFCTILVYI